jgi:hypothetical protein
LLQVFSYKESPDVNMGSLMGGYESMLKKMTPGNFNWFLHSMLSYHTKHVIAKQEEKMSRVINSDGDSSSDSDSDSDSD